MAKQAAQVHTEIAKVMPVKARTYSTGRRKTASARVWIAKGKGRIFINGKDIEKYLCRPVLRMIVNQPFVATNSVGLYDVWCTVEGSGTSGQAGAIRHGISRALDVENSELHSVLRQGGFLTRDGRKVERKKYGFKKSRRRFQFSKR
jgi:small subunit ribosomal protein S9